jgi:hypothetical protein
MPRPTLLDDKVKEKLLGLIQSGHYIKAACAMAGISYSTYHKWRIRGRQGEGIAYVEFNEELSRAEGLARIALVEQWKKHFKRDWRAIAAYMERRWPEEFGRRPRVDFEPMEPARLVSMQNDEKLMNDPEARELIRRLYRRRLELGGS